MPLSSRAPGPSASDSVVPPPSRSSVVAAVSAVPERVSLRKAADEGRPTDFLLGGGMETFTCLGIFLEGLRRELRAL